MEKTINEQLDELFRKLELTYQEEKNVPEAFNVFDAFGIQHSELAWSAWIAYLLNPNEKHGCGDLFLRLFLKQLNLREDFVTKAEGGIVERGIGQIDKKYEKGGRIDIIIHDPNTNNALIFENKIFADDQHKQLYRYYKYATEIDGGNFNEFRIYYLTLLKSKPSIDSIKGEDTKIGNGGELQEGSDFFCISYIDDIKNWLKACMDKTDESKPVRSIIEQSIRALDSMCHQTVVDADFQKRVEELLNANDKKSIKAKLEILKEIKLSEYQECSEQISSLIKIYQRELFSEMIKNHFPSIDICTEGKIDGYWTSLANIHQKGVEFIQIMRDWKPDGTGQLIYCVECDAPELISDLKQIKGVWYKENKDNPLYWSFGLNEIEEGNKVLGEILNITSKRP